MLMCRRAKISWLSFACPKSGNRFYLADPGAQSGSVSNSWLVILPMAHYHIFQVKESGPGPLDFNVVVFF